MEETEVDSAKAAMWLQLADLVETAEADKKGHVSIDQDELAGRLEVEVVSLIQLLDEFRPDFAILFLNEKRVQFSKAFVWMLRALVDPQPEDPKLTAVEARRRVAKSGAEFMEAGQEFDDRTLARVTGVPHFHVGRIIRELNDEVESNLRMFSGGLYNWQHGDEDKWKTEAFPLATAGDRLFVFNIERMESTVVQGNQYNQVNNITYAQVIESLTNIIESSDELEEQEKRTLIERIRGVLETAGPIVDMGVKIWEIFAKASG